MHRSLNLDHGPALPLLHKVLHAREPLRLLALGEESEHERVEDAALSAPVGSRDKVYVFVWSPGR